MFSAFLVLKCVFCVIVFIGCLFEGASICNTNKLSVSYKGLEKHSTPTCHKHFAFNREKSKKKNAPVENDFR